ncbi:hypothetical protein TNCV_2876971 [Trichonephila clavipes]|uniref:Uncharacterized protein n=1 Tax=Trichonephila clavipes TaxID=2585209 RepID=A0A8X6WDC2_TRICX|nr:hypothetical protein TNCV_2876971 [Trichonephila clavipes]
MGWDAITYDSWSPLVCVQDTTISQRYPNERLWKAKLSIHQWVANATAHTAHIIQCSQENVQMFPLPSLYPELSPSLRLCFCEVPSLRSKDELWQMVDKVWRANYIFNE